MKKSTTPTTARTAAYAIRTLISDMLKCMRKKVLKYFMKVLNLGNDFQFPGLFLVSRAKGEKRTPSWCSVFGSDDYLVSICRSKWVQKILQVKSALKDWKVTY